MAVRGIQYPYIGAGRELFLPGPAHRYYPAKRMDFFLRFEDVSSFWNTPFWGYDDKPLVINFDAYGGIVSEPLASPWGPDAFNSQISLQWRFEPLTGEYKIIASAFAAQFVPGVPFPIPWLFKGEAVLTADAWDSQIYGGDAEYFQSGIKVADGFFVASIFAVGY
jgi:hypothetical protein